MGCGPGAASPVKREGFAGTHSPVGSALGFRRAAGETNEHDGRQKEPHGVPPCRKAAMEVGAGIRTASPWPPAASEGASVTEPCRGDRGGRGSAPPLPPCRPAIA